MNRFFYGNFDFENQLCGEVQRPARIERLLLELASSWLAIADAGDRIWCPGTLPEEFLASLHPWGLPAGIFVSEARHIPAGMNLVPWGWSPAAVEFGQRHRLVVNAPPLEVVRLANSRAYSVPWEQLPDDDGNFATLCRTLGEVLACVERLPVTTAWVIKANWSHAARERILGRGPVISSAEIQWVKQRLARDGVVSWELWLQREAEIGIQWHLPQGGQPELIAITELLVDSRGQYTGTRALAHGIGFQPGEDVYQNDRLEAYPTPPEWALQAAEDTRPIVNDIAQRGYFGPVGIDAMRFLHPDGNLPRTRPLQDINVRWTMGRLAAGWFQRLGPTAQATWWHGDREPAAAGVASAAWIATSPETMDGQGVSHRTWLRVESAIRSVACSTSGEGADRLIARVEGGEVPQEFAGSVDLIILCGPPARSANPGDAIVGQRGHHKDIGQGDEHPHSQSQEAAQIDEGTHQQ